MKRIAVKCTAILEVPDEWQVVEVSEYGIHLRVGSQDIEPDIVWSRYDGKDDWVAIDEDMINEMNNRRLLYKYTITEVVDGVQVSRHALHAYRELDAATSEKLLQEFGEER